MRTLALFLAMGCVAFAATWETLDTLKASAIRIDTREGKSLSGEMLSAGPESIKIRTKKGEQLVPKADVRRVSVRDPGRRIRNGLISTGAGAGAGLAIGLAICPGCAGEGSGTKFTAPGAAIGAAIGALGFLPAPYRTVYKSK